MEIFNKHVHAVGIKSSGTASPVQLAMVNAYTLKDVGAEEITVRTMYLAHNAIDRDKDVFTYSALKDFAHTLPGKGFFVKHPRGYDGSTGPGEGRFFYARVIKKTQADARELLREPELKWLDPAEPAYLLEASYYMPITADNKSLLTKIETGVAGDVSIGFSATRADPIYKNDIRIADPLVAPAEALEGSLVWLGAQPGARITKNANLNSNENEDTTMGMTAAEQKEFDTAKNKAAELETQLKTATAERDEKAEQLKVLQESETLKDKSMTEVATLANQGMKYHTAQVDELIALKRTANMLGDDDESIATAKTMYTKQDIAFLQGEIKGLQKILPASAQIKGSATETGAGAPATNDKSFDNPMNNELIG